MILFHRHNRKGFLLLVLLVWQLGLPAHAESQSHVSPLPDQKNVLILHSSEANAPFYVATDKGLSTSLQSGGISDMNQFFESLDLRRNPGPDQRKLLAEEMRARYSHRKFDIIITMFPEALEFVLKDCGGIFPGVPILALYLPKGFGLPKTDRRVIGHFPKMDIIDTVEIALKLVPAAKRVYVVSGVHKADKEVEDQARRDLKKWETQLKFIYLSHLSFDDMLATASRVSPGDLILLLVLTQDVTRKSYTTPIVAQRLSQVSAAPIFGTLDTALGYGIVGGNLINFERIGTQAGRLALNILGSNQVQENTSAVLDVPPVPMFDWRQLKRWNLSMSALPESSIVINREFTLWDYKYYFIGILVFCLVEAVFIVMLVVQRRRKNMAEGALLKAQGRYRDIFDNALEGIFETSPEGRAIAVNQALAKMLGYASPEEITALIGDTGSQVWADPDERLKYMRLLGEQEVVRGFHCRFKRKDGAELWVSLSARQVRGPDGQTLFNTGFMVDITERKRAEEAAGKLEMRYRRLYESMMDGFVVVNMNGTISECNESFREIIGYAPEELSKLTYRDITPEKWHDFEEKIIEEQVLARGYSDVYQKEYRKKDGTVFPIELRTFLLKDEQGNNSRMWAIVRDITEHKRQEDSLRKSEERLRLVLEANSEGTWDWDIPSGHAVFSPRYSAMLGYEPEEFAKSYVSWKNLVHPDDFERVNKAHAEHINEGKEFCVELRMRKKSDDWCWILSRGTVVERDPEGRAIRMVGTHLDITERKDAEAHLRESEERFRQLAENLGDFIWEIDADGLYRYTSPSVEKILAYRPDELIGKMYFYDLFAPDVREELKASAFKVFAKKESFRAFPNTNLTRDGRVVYLETSGSPILDGTGNLMGYRGVDSDTTERRNLEARLRQSEKMEALGTFSGGIAHDFNNILAAMIGFTEMVRGKLPKGGREDHRLTMVMNAGLRGRELIKQMLAFSHQTDVEKEALKMSAIVNETSLFLRASIPSTIRIRVNVASESGPIMGNPTQIQEILMNLCTNAAYPMREKGGFLDLDLCDFSVSSSENRSDGMKPGQYMKITVRDTGIGIPPEAIGKIFDPFFTTKGPQGGTGLGLSVVKRIVDQHDGYISVESTPGKGATFTVCLPAIGQKCESEADSDGEDVRPAGKKRVLLVDDDQMLTEMGQGLLRDLGYEVTVKNSSVEAVKLFSKKPGGFDLIVTDHTMPDMTGLELARACMAIRPAIPIVLATGFSQTVNEAVAAEAGIGAYVMKPMTKAELARAVRKALDGRRG